MTRRAAISLGSNTVHALVADVAGGGVEEIWRRAELTGLGQAVETTGRIGRQRRQETLAHLQDLVVEARRLGAESILCGATAAVRKAPDGGDLLAAAGLVVGHPVQLVSGPREAQLSFLGAASSHAHRGRWLLADLGGGSTELVAAEGAVGRLFVSLEIGSATLAARHLGDPPTREERERVRRDALAALQQAPDCEPARLVVTGGTSSTLPRILAPARPPAVLSRVALLSVSERLDADPAAELAARLDIPAARLQSIRAGIEVLLLLLDWCGLDVLHVSHRGLRHGMLLAFERAGEEWWREEPASAARP